MTTSVRDMFDLKGRVAVITGGAGLLGTKHGEAVAEMGGRPVLADLSADRAEAAAGQLAKAYGVQALGIGLDITDEAAIVAAKARIEAELGPVDILINNAANNPKVEGGTDGRQWSRLENFPVAVWDQDIAVGLTGAFLCSRVFGAAMAERGAGVILSIASDLGVIAPDQRIYRDDPSLPDAQQPVKPVTYSVVKSGLIGLTRYLATYWSHRGVRANALVPGGVYNGQNDAFVERLTNLIPMGRMAGKDEYKAAVAFLISDASSYMTGSNLIVDGGRTCW